MTNKHGGTIYKVARDIGADPFQLLDFSASINPVGFSPRLKKVFQEYGNAILHYPDQEAYDLVCELSRYHRIPPDSILAGNG